MEKGETTTPESTGKSDVHGMTMTRQREDILLRESSPGKEEGQEQGSYLAYPHAS